MMECIDARLLLRFRRPGELSGEDSAALEQHLSGCSACAAQARRDSQFDRVVGQSMRAIPIPAGFRDQLVTRSFARHGALLRRQVYTYASLAAAVLVGVALGTGVIWSFRPAFQTESLATAYSRDVDSPEHTVREWLLAEGLPANLPYDFDFRYKTFHGFTPYAGRSVPVIQFMMPTANGSRAEARVLIVRDSQFQLKDLKSAQDSFCTVTIERRDGYAFVILFTTTTIDPFLKPNTRVIG